MLRFSLVLVIALAACSVPSGTFTAAGDGGGSGLTLVLSTEDVTVDEAGSMTFTVALSERPIGVEIVTVASMNTLVATVAPTSLGFDEANWSVPKTVTVSAPEDTNAGTDTTTVTVASGSAGTVSVMVNAIDNDVLAISVNQPSLQITEGQIATLDVKLTAVPTTAVVVTAMSTDPSVSVTPPSMTFTSDNWDVAQKLQLAAQQDANLVNAAGDIQLTAEGIASLAVHVDVFDDDILAISPSLSSLSFPEGMQRTFDVVLTQQPASDVIVDVKTSSSAVATAMPTPLTFTSSDWNVPKTVTVTAVHDANTVMGTGTITLESSGLITRSVDLTISDDDVQRIVASQTGTLNVNEGSFATFNVSLAYQPSADVAIAVTSGDTYAPASPPSLTFTPANYASTQAVRVDGTSDANAVNITTMVTLKATPMVAPDVTVPVFVDDDDTLAIELDLASVPVTEGVLKNVQVRLTAQPTSAVSVMVTSNNAAVAVQTAMVSFSTSDWNTYKTVTLNGAEDANAYDEPFTLSFAATGIATKNVGGTVDDNDVQQVLVTTGSQAFVEGSSRNILVRLTAQPLVNTTILVSTSDTGNATVDKSSLVFTPSNWMVDQTVIATGTIDADTTNDNVTVTFDGPPEVADASATYVVFDRDTINAPTTATVCAGQMDSIGINLHAVPIGGFMTVTITENTNLFSITPTTMTFTSTNHSTYQFIQVSAVNSIGGTATITLTSPNATTRIITVTVQSGTCA